MDPDDPFDPADFEETARALVDAVALASVPTASRTGIPERDHLIDLALAIYEADHRRGVLLLGAMKRARERLGGRT